MASNAVTTKPLETLRTMLDKAHPTILRYVGGDVLTAQRLAAVAFACASRTPRLLECTAGSIVRSVIQGAELGLEAGSSLGDAYLVPYRNKTSGQYEAQFQPGYRGLARLAIEEGLAVKIDCVPVFSADSFEWDDRHLPPKPKHKPAPLGTKDRGELVGCYCVVTLPGKDQKWDVMTKAEIDHIRAKSKSKDAGPWVSDYVEMAKKTVWKRTSKMLGIRPGTRMAKALETDDAIEAGEIIEGAVAEDPPAAPVAEVAAPAENLSDLTEQMKKRREAKEPVLRDPNHSLADDGPEPPSEVRLPGDEDE